MGKHCYLRCLVVVGPSAASLQMDGNAYVSLDKHTNEVSFVYYSIIISHPTFT